MCGLVAFITKSYNGALSRDRDVFDELLFADTFRGDDSTGIMLVDKDGNLDLAKEATAAPEFQKHEEYEKLMRKFISTGAAVVGHNRKATKGVVNDENAHPFVVDDRIVLVHNGTLYGDHKKIADVEVDSHAIAHLIHKHGDNVEEALKEVNGAYALIWYDVQNKSLNFVRNAARPLWYFETRGGWVFASERGMLNWIGGRNQMQLLHGTEMTELKPGNLLSFTREGMQWKKSERVLALSTKTKELTPDEWAEEMACGWSGQGRSRVVPFSETKTPTVTQVTTAAPLRLNGPLSKDPHDDFTVKVPDGEPGIARSEGCGMSVDRFQFYGKEYPYSCWIKGKCFDYSYVRGDTSGHGYFVYATMVDHPEMMIRLYIPNSEISEQGLINWCAGGIELMFKVHHRRWFKYPDARGEDDGYGVLYCIDWGSIKLVQMMVNEEQNA